MGWGLTSLFFSVIVWLGFHFSFFTEQKNWFWASVIFFSLLSLFVGWVSLNGLERNSNVIFMKSFFSALGLRMFFSLLFIGLYFISVNEKSNKFVVFFLFLYFSFSIFEIYQLLAKLRTIKKNKLEHTTN